MKELILETELIFFEQAKEFFNFPISNSIRTSFWLLNDNESTPSEVFINNFIIETWKIYTLKVVVMERDFLKDVIKKGVEFKLGLFPHEMAIGKINNIIFGKDFQNISVIISDDTNSL
jgi:hypothetical protein